MNIRYRSILAAATFVGAAAALGAARPASAGDLCPEDLDGSGDVGFADLLALLTAWGPCPGCDEDLDGDGTVGFSDLIEVLTAWGDCPGSGLVVLELAGDALLSHPHVNFVKAFNDGRPVSIAIDPANLPAPSQTGDVFITAAKSGEQWLADPALVDVRGAPQTETFAGATIQANTFALVGSSALNADAGTGFGVGYDLVVDFNRNATLDEGDYIDGFGSEAGFYKVHDISASGPLAVSELTYVVAPGSVTPGFEGQNTFYPTGIAGMGQLPLVIISHGNGHNYQWYDYLGNHFASYGYILMSHQNNTMPGIETASTTTYQHTDAFLGQLATIGGGVLQGHVDSSRIVWIGHSRGGEGVARAYTRVHDGLVSTTNYDADDILAVSSIAPNNALGPGVTEPREVNYHLLWGSADGDISGAASTGVWSFAIYERAQGFRQSTYVHGADHNDFNCCGFNDFSGPAGTEIGRIEAQQVAKAVYLALVKRYVDGNIPALEYLWRQYETFKPIGVAGTTTVVSDYKEGVDDPHFVIDDFQSGAGFALSSSGGSVTFDVTNPVEGQMRDADLNYAWTGADAMNGMSRANPTDVTAGAVFDWTGGSRFLEYEVIESFRDFSDHVYLNFRACQQTRHPLTIAELADLTFSVTLRDGDGDTGTINIGVYGGGIEEVYQRSGGWQNEFETIRIRLSDFTHNNAALDLNDILAVRFEFGGGFGSAQGRLGLDDVALSRDAAPPTPGIIAMSLADDVPLLVGPGETTTLTVSISASSEDIVAGSPTLNYRFDGGAFMTVPLDAVHFFEIVCE